MDLADVFRRPDDGSPDQALATAKRLASALRRERARAGRQGYDPARHKRLLAEFAAASARLPRDIRLRRKEFLHK